MPLGLAMSNDLLLPGGSAMTWPTVSTELVRVGVGWPEVWEEPGERWCTREECSTHWWGHRVPHREMVLSYQTTAGLLRQLAVWCGDDGEGQAYWLVRFASGWLVRRDGVAAPVGEFSNSQRIAAATGMRWVPALMLTEWRDALAAILTHIGRDHAIRRALWPDVEVKSGTLATLERDPDGYWFLDNGSHAACFATRAPTDAEIELGGAAFQWTEADEVREVPALANVTDPTEALAAIHTEVCDGN